ncbi:high-potential iron-sulfur protein [Halomonas huangheensis]|uniref:High-potential iron-sulfur protein n=1 Tax=Halomonas huangheensis TaxID=1178482 RepID=W1N4G3_9GAMM|nr:high-potential iron-sulfur protein [Halomonas huangheensis]ALM51586.1 high potential iron-sulfur protein [Halomonas huangheensis]ERL50066.1 hypothetical protein BJB45_02770 [Halomonas huangheensis]
MTRSNEPPHYSRRKFLRQSLIGLAALPLGSAVLSIGAQARDLPRLDENSTQAKALGYVEKASDAEDNADWSEGENCSNCMFYNTETQACQLFPQNSVAAAGWCQSWVAGN